jgi:predicted dehydrogenase
MVEDSTHAAAHRSPLRIAVVGAGLIGRRHIDLVLGSPSCHLAAIADPDPGADTIARDAGVARYSDLDALLASHPPDGVILATPNAVHVAQAVRCLEAEVPVLVEKPIATSVADGLRLAVEAERRGVPLLVGHHRRHSPILAAARGVVASGRLGRIVAATATTLVAKPSEYFDAAPWRRASGGGPILINLIHDIDALRMLVGDVASVRAVASNRVRGFPVEETVVVAMEFAGGALGSLVLSDVAAAPLSWELTAGEDPAYPHHDDRDCYVLAGTVGTLGVPTMRLTTADGPPSWWRRMRASVARPGPADPLARQLEHFAAVIRGEAEPLVTAADATESLRVTLAVAESIAIGAVVACGPAGGADRSAP